MTRGIKNNNPGNLSGRIEWEGLDNPRDDSAQYPGRTASLRFKHPVYGVRACAIDVFGDILHDGLDTLNKLAEEYAPAGDESNDPKKYAAFLGSRLNLDPAEDIVDPKKHGLLLVRAICRMENGVELDAAYGDHVGPVGVDLALLHLNLK